MILINEWLPNPVGTDSGQEWVELWNGGAGPVNLAGWTLSNSKKSYKFGDRTINPTSFLVLNTKGIGLILRNQDETLTLKRADGKTESTSQFFGAAPEGKSWAWNGAGYSWGEPSPGKENIFSVIIAEDKLPRGTILNPFSWVGIEEAALGVAIFLALGSVFLMKKNENKENIFPGRN